MLLIVPEIGSTTSYYSCFILKKISFAKATFLHIKYFAARLHFEHDLAAIVKVKNLDWKKKRQW